MLSVVATEILDHALDDWVHAPELHSIAKSRRPAGDDAALLADVLAALHELVDGGFISIGTVTTAGFVASEEPASVLFERLEREWRALGAPRIPGEVCWISPTPFALGEAERLRGCR